MTAASLAAAAVVVVLLFGAVLVLLGRALRRPGRIDSAEDAAAAVEMQLPGFAVAGAAVGSNACGALVVSRDNRVAAVRRSGGRYRVAEVAWSAVRSSEDGIVVETEDRRVATVVLTAVDALDIRRLTAR